MKLARSGPEKGQAQGNRGAWSEPSSAASGEHFSESGDEEGDGGLHRSQSREGSQLWGGLQDTEPGVSRS